MRNRPFAIVLMLGLSLGILPTMVSAQTVVLQEQFTLEKSVVHSLQPGENNCEYFLWTKLGGTDQRIAFNYVDEKGMTQSDVPKIANVTIVINPAKNIPVAIKTKTDESGQSVWELSMSQPVYYANKECLSGIPTKNAH